jgi:hypothetical protein
VITLQLRNGCTRNLARESGWKRTSKRRKKRNYRELQRVKRINGIAAPGARAVLREWRSLRSQVLGRILSAIKRVLTAELAETAE